MRNQFGIWPSLFTPAHDRPFGTPATKTASGAYRLTTNAPGASVNHNETAGSKLAGPPAHLNQPPIPTKGKNQNIHVSPAVLDAAPKDSEELLQDLRTSLNGLTEAEAEERARTAGPNEVAQSGSKAGSSVL